MDTFEFFSNFQVENKSRAALMGQCVILFRSPTEMDDHFVKKDMLKDNFTCDADIKVDN